MREGRIVGETVEKRLDPSWTPTQSEVAIDERFRDLTPD